MINPGDVVRVLTDPPFSNASGTAEDPDEVRLRWKVGRRGVENVWTYGTDAEIVRDSAGTFHADILVEEVGLHYYRWEGEGGVTAAEEATFSVRSRFETETGS